MISVIIPTYNRANYLREAIQSVLDQDYFIARDSSDCFELMVIDDGSTDTTKEIVKSFGNRVKYYFQKHGGVSAARNRGLRLAKGEFIAFLDSDDLWENKKISVQLSFMETFLKAKACYTEETWIRKGNFVNPGKKHKKYSGWIFDKVLPICLLSLSSTLFRREVFDEIGTFDEELPACEDYDFGIRLAHKYPVYLISKPLIIKRGGHPDQLSRKYWGMDRFRIRALEKALLLDLNPRQEQRIKEEIVKKCKILANGFKKRNKLSEARQYASLMDKHKTGQKNLEVEEK